MTEKQLRVVLGGLLWGKPSAWMYWFIEREKPWTDFGKLCFNPRIQLGKTVHYLPILFIDQLSNRVKDLMVSDASAHWLCSWRD